MKFKTTFSLVCLTWMILLSVGLLNVYANSSCTNYYSTYLAKVEVHNSKREAYHRVQVAVIKATPYASVPPEWKHLENEYNSDPDGFYKTVEGMGVRMPGWVSGSLALLQLPELRQALSEAKTAYYGAVSAYEDAKKKLEQCQGMTVVMIWCERGADCNNPPGDQFNPKAHFNSKCPNYLRVGAKLPLLAQACPGTWWSCEGVGQCPERWSHLSDEEVAESQIVLPGSETLIEIESGLCSGNCGNLLSDVDHLVEDCEGCGKDYYSCTQSGAHGIVHNVYAPVSMKCGHLYRLCASGDHGLKQASCLKDPDCIATNFWLCQHTTHQYASDLSPGKEAPTVPTTLMCRNFHTYSTRDASAVAYHAEVKTCTRCGVSYVECDALDPAKSGCSSGYVWHTTEAQSPDPPPSTDLPPSTDPPSRDPPAEDKEDCGVHIKGTSGSHA